MIANYPKFSNFRHKNDLSSLVYSVNMESITVLYSLFYEITLNNKVIPTILTTIILIALVFAFTPAEKATSIHDLIGTNAGVLQLTKILSPDGTQVTWTFTTPVSAVVHQIAVDNTPTETKGDCSPSGSTNRCQESRFRYIDMEVAGSAFRPGNENDQCLACNNRISYNPILDTKLDSESSIPLTAGESISITFEHEEENGTSGNNDITLEVTVGFTGGAGASLD